MPSMAEEGNGLKGFTKNLKRKARRNATDNQIQSGRNNSMKHSRHKKSQNKSLSFTLPKISFCLVKA